MGHGIGERGRDAAAAASQLVRISITGPGEFCRPRDTRSPPGIRSEALECGSLLPLFH